jgi:protein tyrosine phosphatase (PTP) superfamily phosphohydrolase (DUF442 family)
MEACMKRMNLFLVILAAMLPGGFALAGDSPDLSTEGPVPWSSTYQVYRGGGVWLGGPPDAAALAHAKAKGVTTVVDLRGPEEGTAATAELVAAAGLTHHAVPFPKGAPLDAAAVQRVAALVAAAPPGTVLVHCASGQRAAAWWAADLVAEHGVPVDTALAAARAAGLTKEDTAEAVRAFARATEARRVADDAANQLAATLKTRLEAAIADGGFTAGAKVCAEAAMSITAAVGAASGASVRRTALRVRNPDNRPDAFEKEWLDAQQARVAAGQAAEPRYDVVEAADGAKELRHLRPILFPGGVCVQCHGSPAEIPDEVAAFLRERYPEDVATGFAAGDLRGAISVRVRLM